MDDRYDPKTKTVKHNKCLCCKPGFVYPWRIKITGEFVWVCDECDLLWKLNREFNEENVAGCSEHYFRDAYLDGISGLDWDQKVEALPYEIIAENADPDARFPLEASDICFYDSNCFRIFECSLSRNAFEEWVQKLKDARLQSGQDIKVPRYLFRRYLPQVSIESSNVVCLPNQIFHVASRGLEYTIMYRLYFRHVVYDCSEQKMYHYEIYGLASKNQLTTEALKLHALFYPEHNNFGRRG